VVVGLTVHPWHGSNLCCCNAVLQLDGYFLYIVKEWSNSALCDRRVIKLCEEPNLFSSFLFTVQV